MTTTPIDYFDKVPGTVEQLVLAVITQKLINRDYVPGVLETDFTTNAITYSVSCDSGDNDSNIAHLSVSLTFPTLPYARQILVDKLTFDERVMSINSLSIDTFSLPQKADYPLRSFPVQLPDYLNQLVPQNILERRLMALCLHIRNYRNWVQRWNLLATQWQFATYPAYFNTNPIIAYPVYPTIPIAEIEQLRNELLDELATGIKYKKIPSLGISASLPPSSASNGNPGSARELIELLNDPVTDPANENLSPMSSQLLDELKDNAESNNKNNNGFSPLGAGDPQQNTQPESPTLPNC